MEMFMEFVDRKQRESRKHLKLVEKMLKKGGMQAKAFFEDEDPYIFLKSTHPRLSFDGVRIYEIGDMLAYRVSKEEKTEPYGKAYALNLEEMFNDFMSENDMKEEEAGKQVMHSVLNELKKFFDKSDTAEREMKSEEPGVILKTGGSDYSSLVFNKS